jgi:hypothetical protein
MKETPLSMELVPDILELTLVGKMGLLIRNNSSTSKFIFYCPLPDFFWGYVFSYLICLL